MSEEQVEPPEGAQSLPGDQTVQPPPEEGAPLWMATFGDMMSLLLVFFILLFSMSEIRMERFLLASQSLREAIGGTAETATDSATGLMPDAVDPELELDNPGLDPGAEQPDPTIAGGAPPLVAEALPVDQALADEFLDDVVRQVTEFISRYDLEDVLLVERDPSGVRIRIQASALFGSGQARIDPDSEWIVEFVAQLTTDIEIPVVVTGHADDQPISTPRFASNWELSAARAAGVARLLSANGHAGPRIAVESYGAYRPIADNETPEGRARNRRVEFFYNRNDVIRAVAGWRSSLTGGEEGDGTLSGEEATGSREPGGS